MTILLQYINLQMINYIPINDVLRRIPQAVRKEDSELQLISYALDAYRNLEIPSTTTEKIEFVQVQDHKYQLSTKAKSINFVSYLSSNPTEEECCEMEECCTPETTYFIIDLYSTNYYKNNFEPIKYIGNQSGICSKCINRFVNDSIHTFSVDYNKLIWTSFKDGFLCIHYETEQTNEDEQYLIVQDEDVQNYLAYHAQYMHWLNRSSMHEEGAFRMLQFMQNQDNIYFLKAKGSLLQRNINKQLIQELTTASYNNRIITFLPDNFRRKFDIPYNAL